MPNTNAWTDDYQVGQEVEFLTDGMRWSPNRRKPCVGKVMAKSSSLLTVQTEEGQQYAVFQRELENLYQERDGATKGIALARRVAEQGVYAGLVLSAISQIREDGDKGYFTLDEIGTDLNELGKLEKSANLDLGRGELSDVVQWRREYPYDESKFEDWVKGYQVGQEVEFLTDGMRGSSNRRKPCVGKVMAKSSSSLTVQTEEGQQYAVFQRELENLPTRI